MDSSEKIVLDKKTFFWTELVGSNIRLREIKNVNTEMERKKDKKLRYLMNV